MERVCTQCHAVMGADTSADWCPACGGALMARAGIEAAGPDRWLAVEVDHRGIVLPRRHALGGVITPQ